MGHVVRYRARYYGEASRGYKQKPQEEKRSYSGYFTDHVISRTIFICFRKRVSLDVSYILWAKVTTVCYYGDT